jgi:peptidase M23-like protein
VRVKGDVRVGPAVLLACLVALLAPAAPASASAMRTRVIAPPSPVLGTDDQRHLVYEIQLENTSTRSMRVDRILVRDARTGERLARFGPPELATHLLVLELGPSTTLPAGATGFAFIDVPLRAHGPVPKALEHRFRLTLEPTGRRVVDAAATTVDRRAPIVLEPPLRGANLLVGDGCCSGGDHAHGLIPVGDGWVNAQRYAIDWLRLDDNLETTFTGDPSRNESYLIWGSQVLAAAPGTVVATRDGIPENTPQVDPPDLPFEDAGGNFVVEDLGHGRFAYYAHLQPGSLTVQPGDRVRTHAVLGLVGNSGGSSEPHLHFQVMDGPGAPNGVVANALPFVFDAFRLQGVIPDLANPVVLPPPPPAQRRFELPLVGDIQSFDP